MSASPQAAANETGIDVKIWHCCSYRMEPTLQGGTHEQILVKM